MANEAVFEIKQVLVEKAQDDWRADRFLAEQAFVPSRTQAAWLLHEGLVTSKGKRLKASTKVYAGQILEVRLPQAASSTLEPYALPLEILYEDDDCAVINKPSGLVVHPAAGHAQDTLVNALLFNIKNLSMGFHEQRPGIVHRLDRDTSGILVVAKNNFAHEKLAAQFKAKSVHRVYWALVHGLPKPSAGTIRTHLARHPTQRKKYSSQTSGKLAITHFKTLKTSPQGITLLRCQLETGRTHQIRVHLSEAQHPIVGDPIYGSAKWNKIWSAKLQGIGLHARELGFTHPRTGEPLHFTVGWPDNLAPLVAQLGFADV